MNYLNVRFLLKNVLGEGLEDEDDEYDDEDGDDDDEDGDEDEDEEDGSHGPSGGKAEDGSAPECKQQ